MTTKEVILEKAIELFNRNGYASVSMRDIADAANKSVGNITYHFKKKSDLICAIVEYQYKDLKKLDLKTEVDVSGFNEELKVMVGIQKKYYFYFSNMIELRSTYQEILVFQKKVKEELVSHFSGIFEYFETQDIFKTSPYKDYYKQLSKAIVLLMMSWIQQTLPDKTDKLEELLNMVWSILYLCLTENGIRMYKQIASIGSFS